LYGTLEGDVENKRDHGIIPVRKEKFNSGNNEKPGKV
jgi:hypothetical protein